MKQLLRDAARKIITASRYPKPVRHLLNRTPAPVNISTGIDVDISRGCVLHGDIRLDDNVGVGRDCILSGNVQISKGTNLVRENELIGEVRIGRYCAVGPHTIFQEPNHMMSKPGLQFKLYRDILNKELGHETSGPITVGNDVWFGTRATVLSGVDIGHGSIIGAGAIVTDDVEPYSIVTGIPAKQTGWRFSPQIREELLNLEWWEWTDTQIRENREFFETDLTSVESIYDLLD